MTPGGGTSGGTATQLRGRVGQRIDGVGAAAAGRPWRGRRGSARCARGWRPWPAGRSRPPSSGSSASPSSISVSRASRSGDPLGVDATAARLDREQPERRVEDHARSAPCRRPSPRTASGRRSGPSSTTVAVGEQQRQPRGRGCRTSRRRGGSCRGCRWRWRRRRSRSGCPGVTGTKNPRGTMTRSRSSRLTPGRHRGRRRRRRRCTASWARSCRRSTMPPPFWAGSPYERPSPRAMPPRAGGP